MAILTTQPGVMNQYPGMLSIDDNRHLQELAKQKALYEQSLNMNPQNMTRETATDITANTGNARNSMLAYPDHKIGVNEMLMRTGGAVMGGAQQGGLQAYSDGLAQYGAIQDYNRGVEADKFNNMAAAMPDPVDNSEQLDNMANIDQQINKMTQAISALEKGGLTGLFEGNLKALFDTLQGNPAARSRLILKELRVDDALRRISQTKGAISNKEMDLFLSPAPSIRLDQESTWIEWIRPQLEALRAIQARQRSGILLPIGSGENDAATSGKIDSLYSDGSDIASLIAQAHSSN